MSFDFRLYDETKLHEMSAAVYVYIRQNINACQARKFMVAAMKAGDDYKEVLRIAKLYVS